jgi:hypothetical protein
LFLLRFLVLHIVAICARCGGYTVCLGFVEKKLGGARF